MTKVLSLRVADDLAEWASAYAKERGVTRQALIEGALRSFREDCARGVPDLEDERVPRPERKPTPPASVVPPVKRYKRSSQSELAMARMRRMDPRRYG
jgi:3-deoxy-D-arabino-heptulosonate 7-phosphate (DAHP) synthase class II